MSNRVEDLERQVAELQAAVNGLTEELVEMKERVRQLEDAREVTVDTGAGAAAAAPEEPASDASDTSVGERRTHSDDHVEVVERTGEPSSADGPGDDGTAGVEADSPAADGGDVDPETAPPDAEAVDTEGSEDGESDDSDIIVA